MELPTSWQSSKFKKIPFWLLLLLPVLTLMTTLITVNITSKPSTPEDDLDDISAEPDLPPLPPSLQIPNPPVMSPLHHEALPNIAALPCKNVKEYCNCVGDYKREEGELESYRDEWQTWMATRYVTHYSNFDVASETMEERGMPGFKGRGIVTVFGTDSHFKFFNASMTFLKMHNSTLPVEVWAFDNELSEETVMKIMSLSTPRQPIMVRFADDPRNYLPLSRGKVKAAYHGKVAAVLNSGFEEFMFLDVDVVALKNPEYLFNTIEYNVTGTLFWPDYWKTMYDNPIWTWMNETCVDEWEQESGIMVVNKRKAWKALVLNWFLHRDEKARGWHNFIYGDKEIFRFSWRVTRTPHHFVQHWLTPGGFITPTFKQFPFSTFMGQGEFCGNTMMQHDPRGNLLFAHINYFKHTGKYYFTEKFPPLRYVKRYRPYYNVNLPDWYNRTDQRPFKTSSMARKRNETVTRGDPDTPYVLPISPKRKNKLVTPPKGAHPGTIPAFAGTEGFRAGYTYPMNFECLDLLDHRMEDGIQREAEIIDLDEDFPGTSELLYHLLMEEEANETRWEVHRKLLSYTVIYLMVAVLVVAIWRRIVDVAQIAWRKGCEWGVVAGRWAGEMFVALRSRFGQYASVPNAPMESLDGMSGKAK
ncbi:hypothetical protein HDU97_003863 [Phlyctochytrium planicorne]|nr:hypothetical protein HDU97_003863 [Phlyctochytrium planicorne]